MSPLFNRPTASVFIEFTDSAVHIASDARSLDLPIERTAGGALTPASADSVREALRPFAGKPGAEQAFCLLPARGVSLRRIMLPAATAEEIDRLLPLQIDAHFPLPSEELSWGCTLLPGGGAAPNGRPLQELLVAAVKKEAVEQVRQILAGAGFHPLFGIAALAREGAWTHRPTKAALLEIGGVSSELLTFDERGPSALRVIALGSESSPSADPLLNALKSNGAVEKVLVSGKSSSVWSARIAPHLMAEPLPLPAGQSAAITGLRESLRRGHEPLLVHAARESVVVQRAPTPWRWAAAAVFLLLVWIGLRYAEPIIRNARLTAAIAELRAARDKLPRVDLEAAFLQYIHTNQPGYLDAVAAIAGAAQPGTKLDNLSIARKGDISMRGTAQNGQAAATLRSKMIESGLFSNVVLDEQTPGQNQQVTFRMTAQLRPEADRQPPAGPATAAATNKAAAKPAAARTNSPPAPPTVPTPSPSTTTPEQ